MLRKKTGTKHTTDQIIGAFKQTINAYEKTCHGFLNEASKKALQRKEKFHTLLSILHDFTPEEVLIEIYRFYNSQKSIDGRLMTKIGETLMDFCNIHQNPISYGNTYEAHRKLIEETDRTHRELRRYIQSIHVCSDTIYQHQVRKTAQVLAQAKRETTHKHGFFALPAETMIKIAALVTDELDPKVAEKIANDHFCRPLIKK